MGVIFDTINKEAQAIAAAHSDPKKGPLDVEGELAKLQSQVDKMKDVALKKVMVEYDIKTKALVPSIPIRIAKHRLDRFNSTDVKKYTEDGIRKNLNSLIAEHTKMIEDVANVKTDLLDTNALNDAISEGLNDIAQEKQNFERRVAEAADLNKIAQDQLKKEAPKDFLLRARTLAQQAEHDIEQQTQERKEAYEYEEKKIDNQAKAQGYGKGARDVEKFNRIIDKAARKIVNVKRQIIDKINIEKNKIIQAAKLKIMALLGL